MLDTFTCRQKWAQSLENVAFARSSLESELS